MKFSARQATDFRRVSEHNANKNDTDMDTHYFLGKKLKNNDFLWLHEDFKSASSKNLYIALFCAITPSCVF